MLFVPPQGVVIRLKLYKIGCMMRNFIPNVHGEVHILTTRHHAAWCRWAKNMLIGLVRIRIKFYLQMSVACAFNQTFVREVFGGSLVRMNVSDTLSARWWFPDVLGWHYVGPTYATGGHGRH